MDAQHFTKGTDVLRKHLVSLFVLAGFAVLLVSCGEIRRGAEVEAVEATVLAIYQADEAGDLERVANLYAEDAQLFPPNGERIDGRPAIRTHYANLFANFRLEIDYQIHDIEVDGVLSFVAGENQVIVIPLSGGAAPRRKADKFLMVLRKRGGQWKIYRLMWN